MTYTDAQGRPELVMDPDIASGAATFRVVSDGAAVAEPRPKRPLSPVRVAAAEAAAAAAAQSARP